MRTYTVLSEDEKDYLLNTYDSTMGETDGNLFVTLKSTDTEAVVIGKLTNGSYLIGSVEKPMRICDEAQFKQKLLATPVLPICPKCHSEISHVIQYFIERKTIELYPDGSSENEDNYDGEDIDYCCPKCSGQITTSYTTALEFLNMDKNWDK
jgi:gentisate 1,2-dioxygenase